jgi:hypothetical protein
MALFFMQDIKIYLGQPDQWSSTLDINESLADPYYPPIKFRGHPVKILERMYDAQNKLMLMLSHALRKEYSFLFIKHTIADFNIPAKRLATEPQDAPHCPATAILAAFMTLCNPKTESTETEMRSNFDDHIKNFNGSMAKFESWFQPMNNKLALYCVALNDTPPDAATMLLLTKMRQWTANLAMFNQPDPLVWST